MGSLENDMKYKPNRKLKKDRVSVNTFIGWIISIFKTSICIIIHVVNPIGVKIIPIFLNRFGSRIVFIMYLSFD